MPVLALGACTARIEEAGPALRAALERAASGEPMTADEETLFFHGLHILGAGRDWLAFQPLLRLLRPGGLWERVNGMGKAVEITYLERSGSELRELAAKAKDADVARRLLAIALLLDGWPRQRPVGWTARRCATGFIATTRAVLPGWQRLSALGGRRS